MICLSGYIWTATDYAEDPATNETFAIRFKTPEIGTDFKAAFDSAREKSKGGAVSKKSESEKQTASPTKRMCHLSRQMGVMFSLNICAKIG